MYKEIKGNLITLALQGMFDVVAHGCNCFCRMKKGIAPQMAEAFSCDKFPMELKKYVEYGEFDEDYIIETGNYGNINKLGQIDYKTRYLWFKHPMVKENGLAIAMNHMTVGQKDVKKLIVINAYTQHKIKKFNNIDYGYTTTENPFDYEAFTLCMRKINATFKGMKIGLPKIGSHLAGGDWERIKIIIQKELKDCNVTIVVFE